VREKEVCVDSCAASRKRRLDLLFFPDLVQTKALRGRSKERSGSRARRGGHRWFG
jgi:hypothetical protein